jgi:PTH1 family peptidyl-tRNA hydrolase
VTTEGDAPRPRVILGLGNPGARYAATRHNVGFRVVEELARRFALRLEPGECNALMAEREELLLVAPQTYMNRSGYCARCLAERRELVPKDFLVVYDEVHLPLGALRLRGKGSPAGHRGMESVIENFGSAEVPRLRLGVAAGEVAGEDLVDFVLGDFLPEESSAVDEMVALAADACQLWAHEGVEAAMQRFNRSAPPGEAMPAEAGESRG